MIKNIIIIIFIIIFTYLVIIPFINNFIINYIFQDYNKKVLINEDKNDIILFKINDPVSDMKTLNIIYHCEKEKDEEDEIV
jgi:hypothetical protein